MRTLPCIALIALLCALLTGSVASAQTPSALPRAASQRIELTPVSDLLAAINDVRVANHVPPLRLSPDLVRAAHAHSVEMLSSGRFAHESADGTAFAVRVSRYYGPAGGSNHPWATAENILSSSTVLDARRAVRLWLQSPPHRRNLLDRSFRDVGISGAFTASAHGDFGHSSAWVVTLDLGRHTS